MKQTLEELEVKYDDPIPIFYDTGRQGGVRGD